MARRAVSYADRRASFPPFQMKQLLFIPLWSIFRCHSKYEAFASLILWEKWKMRVYQFAIQCYPHYIMTCNPVLYGWIFLYLDFTQWMTTTYSVNAPKQRTNRVGYDDAVAETVRLTEARPELDEQEQRAINERLPYIVDHIHEQRKFASNILSRMNTNPAGQLLRFPARSKKISATDGTIVMADGCKIRLSDITDLSF